MRCVSLFKTIQIFQSILSGGSQPFSRQMSEMSNAEEDCIDATEQGKGTLHTFTVDIAFIWGEEKGSGEDKEIVYMLLSRVREFSYMYTQLGRKKRVVYMYIGCAKE